MRCRLGLSSAATIILGWLNNLHGMNTDDFILLQLLHLWPLLRLYSKKHYEVLIGIGPVDAFKDVG